MSRKALATTLACASALAHLVCFFALMAAHVRAAGLKEHNAQLQAALVDCRPRRGVLESLGIAVDDRVRGRINQELDRLIGPEENDR